jgi:hypothetical protein
MLSHILVNWKTSLAGTAIGGIAFAVMQAGCGATSWKSWLLAVMPVLLGLIAKDPGK